MAGPERKHLGKNMLGEGPRDVFRPHILGCLASLGPELRFTGRQMDRQKGGETKHGGGGMPYLAIMQLPLIQLLGAPHPSLSPECHKGKVSPSDPSLPPQATPLDLMQAEALPFPTAPWTATPEV